MEESSKSQKHKNVKKKSKEVEDLEKRVADLEDQLKRAVADYRNLEKRMEDEKKETIKFGNRELLTRIIPAFDTLFMAEKYINDEGIKITAKSLYSALSEVGVQRLTTEGQNFDPNTMEAVTVGDGEENKVLEELRPGYTLNGRLIRPAQVKVGRNQG